MSPKTWHRRPYLKHGGILMPCATRSVFRNGSPVSLIMFVFVGYANRDGTFSGLRNRFSSMKMLDRHNLK